MNRYAVEIMSGNEPTSLAFAKTTSPQAAAEWITGRKMQDRQGEADWVRVTDQSNRVVYKFAFK
ncbi:MULTISPECIES: hypothetical protein [unclassified Mesorhizobium]|uniref:hypothetical protein n=1 Tax=unclassified Mesorhizobium TaxID=325217 RepID=UPI000F75C973|nr:MULTISPECIES: hypothetical protein [unclassified Mesorhizobium]AZO10550.1 hypothetical protein EJ074_16480 [Mesorhizobium sp. M3A.F.Ca.ET.080.04.2.1]RWB65572.1 MAG: hypothetical protein EOQ49_31705 [Mesorhizobium sp.]RWB84144.1 MAG: hypothetical protein EOQ52_24660 [Mesorhizobium sp.]RWF23457.1 MAG: hypothetical protein EOS64_11380 [Mesorhizobium sp.]